MITERSLISFIILANLKFFKKLCVEDRGYIQKILSEISVCLRSFLFYFFCFAINKMVDNDYSTDIYKSAKIILEQ